MPRVGRHPLKQKSLKEFQSTKKNITMTTIVFIPTMDGYWKGSLDNLKLFFESLLISTRVDFDLMVFDNGSCKAVIDYLIELKEKGVIHYLILSKNNLRKIGALSYLLNSAPGSYISYADSDVYFLPGWLEESLISLKTFPEAAKITALPIAGGDTTKISKIFFEEANQYANIKVETGKIIHDKYINAHALSIGKSLDQFNIDNPDRKDIKLTRNGKSVFLSSADFQFTIRKSSLKNILPLGISDEKDYYDPIYSPVLENKLIKNNWWLISTDKYLVHHLGNNYPNLKNELPWIEKGLLSNNRLYSKKTFENKKSRLAQSTRIRRVLKKVNTWTYKKLYD